MGSTRLKVEPSLYLLTKSHKIGVSWMKWGLMHCVERIFIFRRGSFKPFYIQKHGTEIIEVKVWPHIVACYRREIFKVTSIL